jgi:hypothetical protein
MSLSIKKVYEEMLLADNQLSSFEFKGPRLLSMYLQVVE